MLKLIDKCLIVQVLLYTRHVWPSNTYTLIK